MVTEEPLMAKTTEKPADTLLRTASAPAADRSREIEQVMDKEPHDHVKCVHVFDDFYRCNWWAAGTAALLGGQMIEGLEVSTYRVRKSQMVRATMSHGKLLVEDATFKKP
jgi:hypothetical protein